MCINILTIVISVYKTKTGLDIEPFYFSEYVLFWENFVDFMNLFV